MRLANLLSMGAAVLAALCAGGCGGGEGWFDKFLEGGASLQPGQTNALPVALAGPDCYGVLGIPLPLGGSCRDTSGNTNHRYRWTVLEHPAGSTALPVPLTVSNPSFTPDAEGTYVLQLEAGDASSWGPPDLVTVRVCREVATLPFDVADAEYSYVLDRLVIVSTNPAKLHLYDLQAGTASAVVLPESGKLVSVGPDGRYAAVAHDSKVSMVCLDPLAVVVTVETTNQLADIALARNGQAYASHRNYGYWVVRADFVAGKVHLDPSSFYGGFQLRCDHAGDYLYSIATGYSPCKIYKAAATNTVYDEIYEWPYHSEHDSTGGVWLARDGSRMVDSAGNVVTSSTTKAADMLHLGVLSYDRPFRHVLHQAADNRFIAVPGSVWEWQSYSDNRFLEYDASSYTCLATNAVPWFRHSLTNVSAGTALFSFGRATGSGYWLFLRGRNVAGTGDVWGIAAY